MSIKLYVLSSCILFTQQFGVINFGGVTSVGYTELLVYLLTHWDRGTHICIGKLSIIGSDNGLWPGRCQAIIWANAGILLVEPLGTNFSEILIGNQIFSFSKMRLKMSSVKWPASMC